MKSEAKILEAVGRQRDEIISHIDKKLDVVGKQNKTIIKKLQEHDSRFDRVESAVLENNKAIKENRRAIEENRGVIKENRQGIKENGIKIDRVESKLDTAITNHEGRIRKLETKLII